MCFFRVAPCENQNVNTGYSRKKQKQESGQNVAETTKCLHLPTALI